MKQDRKTSLLTARECINAALRHIGRQNDLSAEVAIDNAIECLKSVKKIK